MYNFHFMSINLIVPHINCNPDAVCASIGYQYLVHEEEKVNIEVVLCGDMSSKTRSLLKYCKIDYPKVAMDVHPRAHLIEK